MKVQNIVSLFLFMTYASSAPSGCIESCTSYLKQQTQISGDLLQTASHLQGLDYSRPGTWSEHNEYNVDNGQGKVHEERGQYITGPKTVRYYKKNYSSSYSTRYPNSEIFPDFEYESNKYGVHLPTIQEVSKSQNNYNQMGNSESVGQYKYNKIQNQQHTQSSYTKSNVQNERLEDLGRYSGNSQVIQQGASNTQISRKPYDTNTQSGNWSSVNSYKTDGGRGRVFEEDGQYVSGAQKVRYYKRNYTSSYSSSDGIPIPEVTKTGIQDIQQEMEKFHKEIGKGFNQMSTADVIGSSNIGQTYVDTHDLSDNIHNINSDNHRGQNSYRSSLSTAHTEEQHSSHITNDHLPYRNPYQNTYDRNSYGTHEKHEEYVQKLQPINQLINPTSGYTSVLTGNSGYNRNTFSGSTLQQTDNFQQTEMLDAQQSRISQTQTFLDNLRNSAQSQSSAIHSSMSGVPHYKEHWSASHTKETSIPQHSIDITHMNQQSDHYTNNQYDSRHNLYQGTQQRDNYLHQSKESGKKTLLQKLVTGTDTVDCDYNSHSNTQYQTKYKRSAKYDKEDEVQTHSNFNDDFTQQTGEFDDLTQQTSGKPEFHQESQLYQSWAPYTANQQSEDITQQTTEYDDLTQQTSGKLEFGQQSQQPYQPWISHTADQEIEDFTQKTGELNDLNQQTSGNFELGEDSQFHQSRKLHTSNQELDDLTEKTRKYDDFAQQTSGKVEFGQQSQQSHQAWDLQSTIQQLEDLIQKTKESDNNAQQSFSHEHDTTQQSHHSWNLHNTIQQLEDLIQKTKKSDDFTQQTSGKLEFGQESQQFYQSEKPYSVNQQLGSFTQKTESQQSSGKLMFGQESEQSFSTWEPSLPQQSEIFVQSGDNLPKPAEKPKPRSRYSRLGSTVNPQLPNQNQKNINLTTGDIDIYELPPEVNIERDIGNDKNQNIRGDQGQDKDVSNNLKPQTGSSIYDNVDPGNWLHKSNDATVGLQWHYTYHPSDRRQFVQQIDHKNKESLQSTQTQFSNLQQNFNQERQNKYVTENSQQESQNYASEQGIKSVRKPFRYIQQENKLVSSQQITENENLQKHTETALSELKPRILEVYGGGQYDPAHSEDIYSRVTANPSATLPPESNKDPWDIREIPITTTELTPPPLPVEPLDVNDTIETPRRSSVWSRIGHKITTTFDKAKEKARNFFG